MAYASATMGSLADVAQARRAARLMVSLAVWRTVMSAVSAIDASHARHRRMGHTAIALPSLSSRMLRDVGIERQNIPHVARHIST